MEYEILDVGLVFFEGLDGFVLLDKAVVGASEMWVFVLCCSVSNLVIELFLKHLFVADVGFVFFVFGGFQMGFHFCIRFSGCK